VLDCSKIRDAFGLHLPSWQDGLDGVIGEMAG
jgi:dTDP-4-dehydrorhamnose reductase